MKAIFSLTTILFVVTSVQAQKKMNVYQYTVDLVHVDHDQVKVTLITPTIETEETLFHFPIAVPGVYQISNYGKFISHLEAFSKDGQPLPVEKVDENTWKIKQAQTIAKLTYEVEDSFDSPKGKTLRGLPESNYFTAGTHFLINTSGVFGFFEDKAKLPYIVTFAHPQGFYGATSLKTLTSRDTSDTYIISSYAELADSPVMYSIPDTAVFTLAGAEIMIAVYSPNKIVRAEALRPAVYQMMSAAANYFKGDFPLEKYIFLIHALPESFTFMSIGLEHSFSCVAAIPEMPVTKLSTYAMQHLLLHEFFHIIAPLAIHSEEIEHFDFVHPSMSSHAWFYEGLTDYQVVRLQVKNGLLSPEQFLQEIQKRVKGASHFEDTVSLMSISKHCLDIHYKKSFYNVYLKGFVVAASLDLLLLDHSNGKYGVQDLVTDLGKTYKKGNPFKDDEFLDHIAKLTYPEIRSFLHTYIEGNDALPYAQIFQRAGVNYQVEGVKKDFSLGARFEFNKKTKRLLVNNLSVVDKVGKKLGYKEGDELVNINGLTFSPAVFRQLPDYASFFDLKKGKRFTVVVARMDENGKEQLMTLQAKARKVRQRTSHYFSFSKKASARELKLRKAWLTK